MQYSINRNGSGYYDPTAYKAIKNYMRNGENSMKLYKGDIVEIETNTGLTKEAVILSVHSKFSTILILTENESLPYSVNCKGLRFTDPGMIQYVFNDNVKELIRSMKQDEIDYLLQEVVDGLGYEAQKNDIPEGDSIEVFSEELTKVKAERDVYKSLYENLIGSMIAK